MFQPSLDPTIRAIAHSKGCTYLEAAKASCDRPGRQLSLPVAMPLVQGFARFAAEALFAYEPVNDVMLFTVLSDCTAPGF
jgi:hypothetical protein